MLLENVFHICIVNQNCVSKVCKRVDHQGKISQKSSSGEPFLKPTGGECAGTAVCPNTTTLARGQQRPTDPGRRPGENGHLLGVFLKCT